MRWTFSTHTPRRGACRRVGWEHDFTLVPFVCLLLADSMQINSLCSCCVQGPVPTPRGCHASALLGNKGYISGGAVSRPYSAQYINLIYRWGDIFNFFNWKQGKRRYFSASSFCGVGLGKVRFLLKHPFPVMMWLCLHAQSKIRNGSCVDDWSAQSPDLHMSCVFFRMNWITNQHHWMLSRLNGSKSCSRASILFLQQIDDFRFVKWCWWNVQVSAYFLSVSLLN